MADNDQQKYCEYCANLHTETLVKLNSQQVSYKYETDELSFVNLTVNFKLMTSKKLDITEFGVQVFRLITEYKLEQ